MSPKRSNSNRSRRASSASSLKPYTKATTPEPTPASSTEIAQQDKPGFPTRDQYKHIETVYLNSLTSRRREKALISQDTFDRIWDVLQNRDDSPEDGKFKFWVRRNFVLGTLNKDTFDLGALPHMIPDTQTVLLHKGSLVALQERLYDLLCYAHGFANHGGRDRTLTALRKYYTWVPKDIIAQFTIACPTCMIRKSGLSKNSRLATKDNARHPNETHLPALRNFLSNVAAQEGYDFSQSENDWPSGDRANRQSAFALNPTLDHKTTQGISPNDVSISPSDDLSPGPRSLPMSREVSLYHGLPNGWQFRTDYATAHAEFMKRKNEGTLNPPNAALGKKRPRIPSVAPLIGPDYVPHHDDVLGENSTTLPPVMRPSNSDRASEESEPMSPGLQSFRAQLLEPFSLGPPLLPVGPPLKNDSSVSRAQSPSQADQSPSLRPEHDSDNQPLLCSSKVHRAAAPPALNLTSLNSIEAIQSFLTHRDARDMSPHSPLSQPSLDSPTSSVGSAYSPEFSMLATSCSSSAASSALPTPVDDDVKCVGVGEKEMGRLEKELADETEGMISSVSAVSMQAVCHEVI